jgi:hypothetical protein
MTTAFHLQGLRELDARTSDGIEVRLLWHELNGLVCVHVCDSKTGEEFVLVVNGAEAMEAFQHPFAYTGLAASDSGVALDNRREEVGT